MNDVVGHRFRAWDGHTYICDSHAAGIGYWMTREDAPPEHRADTEGQWRRNVSERAIGRTHHHVDETFAASVERCGGIVYDSTTYDATAFTCATCNARYLCEHAFDLYNTDGDCLAEK